MSSEWPRAKVADLQAAGVLLVEDGNHGEYRPRPDEFTTSGVCFIRAADMADGRVLFESAERISAVARDRIRKGVGRPGDVLLSHKGTVGKVALVPDHAPDFVCSPQTTFWRVIDPTVLDRRFVFSYLQSREFKNQLSSRKGETDMADYVSLTAQRQLTLPMPSLRVQREIGGYEEALATRIALLRETNATLEAIAQALFKSWFVDFDPVRAKSQGLAPAGMDEATAALFPDGFEKSALGLVPKGWGVTRLGDVVSRITKGTTPTTLKRPFVAEGINFVKAESMTDDGSLLPEKFAYIDSETHDLLGRSKLAVGDVLISIAGTIGRIAVMTDDFLPANTNQAVALIRPQSDRIPSGFIARFLQRSDVRQSMAERVVQGVQANLSLGTLSELPLVLPPPTVVWRLYDTLFSGIDALKVANRRQARTLTAVRDTLLPRLISGQLRLPMADLATAEVVHAD